MPEIKLRGNLILADRTLWGVCATAAVIRIVAALYQGNGVAPLPGVSDQISYHTLALRVLRGHGFSFATGWWPATPAGEPTAHWSYLYVLFLGLIYTVFGASPLAARLIQSVVAGLLQPLLTFRIGSRLFGRRVGLISAALAAFNGYFVFYSGALMTESLYIVAVLWLVDICTAMSAGPKEGYPPAAKSTWAFLGLALGAAVLLRQAMLLLVPVILPWVAWRSVKQLVAGRTDQREPALLVGRRTMLTLAILAACILPWTIRNYNAFGGFYLLNTNAGFAFFWGNHPVHGTRFFPLLPADKPTYGALIPHELRTLNEAQMDRALLLRGLAFVEADPVRYLRLSLSRCREYFKFWPEASSGKLSNYVRVFCYGIFLPFIVAGLACALFREDLLPKRDEDSRASVVFVVLVSVLYALIHLLTWTLVRYRLPMDALTLPFAAVAMVLLYDRLRAAIRPTSLLQHRASL
jgi:hypothetical protein